VTALAEPLRSSLAAELRARLGERGSGGIAVALGGAAEVSAVWLPATLPDEPRFLTYSITKTFTAALATILGEEGRLSLEDPLSRWFPEIDSSPRISVRMLLNHTAGIPDYGGEEAYHEAVRRSPGRPWSLEEFANHSWRKGLRFEPGAGWAYSNPGYLLVKRILESVAGESYADLVRSRICRGLGLRRTFVPESLADLSSLAPTTSTLLSPDREPLDVRACYHPGWVSHGVVASTPSEVASFLQALFSGRLVRERSMRELVTLVPVPHGPPRWRKPSYGLGVMADPESPLGPLFGHNGGGPGYDGSAFHAPRLVPGGATICALCAVEDDFLAENLVLDAFELLREMR